MNLSGFDSYLIVINIIGFLLFFIYMYCPINFSEDNRMFDQILTIVSLLFGSLGMIIAIILFGRTPRSRKKETMMSRVFVTCVLIIQIIVWLVSKGYIANDLTIDFRDYFNHRQWLIVYLGIINLITFAMFAADKFKAIQHETRIRISTLLLLSFAGGSIGGLLAMYLFRHKTKTDYFTVGMPLILLMQVIVLLYMMNRP